jgi:phenylacetate-CoA ligase
VECRDGVVPESREVAGRLLEQRVKDRIGVSVAVRVLGPDTIEHSMGKARRLVDKRPKA